LIQIQKIATLAGHRDCVYALAHDSTGQYLYSADGNGMIAHWDLAHPEVGDLIIKIPNSVYAMHLLPDNNALLVGQNFDGLHWIDLAERREMKSIKLTNSYIFAIQSVGNDIFTACGDGTVLVLDLDNWAVRKYARFSDKSARCIAVNSQNNEIAVGYSDYFIRVLDITTLNLKYEVKQHQNSVFSLAYSPDGQYLLSGSRDAHLKIRNVGVRYSEQQSIAAHIFAINSIAYSPDGQHFATGSMDKSVKIWSATDFRLLKVLDKARHAGHGTSVNTVLWSPYQNYLLSAGDDRMIGVWNIQF
jgi:hypothetical protein